MTLVTIHMALSEVQQSGLSLRRVEGSGAEGSVRHVDELTDEELSAFLAGINGASVTPGPLEAGEVIVFTDYFRVEQN